MAYEQIKRASLYTVGDIKEALKGIDDDIRVQGDFYGEVMEFGLWRECDVIDGKFVTMDEGMGDEYVSFEKIDEDEAREADENDDL